MRVVDRFENRLARAALWDRFVFVYACFHVSMYARVHVCIDVNMHGCYHPLLHGVPSTRAIM